MALAETWRDLQQDNDPIPAFLRTERARPARQDDDLVVCLSIAWRAFCLLMMALRAALYLSAIRLSRFLLSRVFSQSAVRAFSVCFAAGFGFTSVGLGCAIFGL